MKAALRDVALVVSGLGSCVMTDIVDDQTHSVVRQVAVGPVTGRTTQFTLRTAGMMYKQRYKVAHTPQPMPSLDVAREIALDVARKRADTGEKLTLPKVPPPSTGACNHSPSRPPCSQISLPSTTFPCVRVRVSLPHSAE